MNRDAVAAWQPKFREVERKDVDGVPVLWAPVPGPAQATLLFRSGFADEPLYEAGITHLVEHLALHELGRTPYASNGSVSAFFTEFWAEGRPEELVEFVERVCSSLAALPFERLERELGILRSEDASAGSDSITTLKRDRFGARGLGLASFRQLGLFRVEREDVERWARDRFVAENAVVWMTVPPPDALTLPLRSGSHHPLPARPATNELSLPALVLNDEDVVAMTFLEPRSGELKLVMHYLNRRIEDVLREERGLIYSSDYRYEVAARNTIHAGVLVECPLPENAQAVFDGVLEQLDRLAAGGLTEQEVTESLLDFERMLEDDQSVLSLLDYTASSLLAGEDVLSERELWEEEVAVTPESSAAVAANLADSLLMLAPDRIEPPADRFRPLPRRPDEPVTGGDFRAPSRLRRGRVVVRVGDEGVTWFTEDGRPATFRWGEAATVVVEADARTVIADDGTTLTLAREDVADPDRLFALVDAKAPRDRRIDLQGSTSSR